MSQEIPGLIYLPNVRLSFPHLAVAHKSGPEAPAKFSADFIMDATNPGWEAFFAQVQQLANDAWGAQAANVLQWIYSEKRARCFGSGEECIDKNTMQPYVGYPGKVFIKANNDAQPALFGADGNRLMDAVKLYGGCFVNAQIKPWLQDNVHGKAVRCELVGVQFNADGEAFGAAPIDPNSLFKPVAGAPAPTMPGAPAAQGYAPPPGAPAMAPPPGYAPPAAPPAPAQQAPQYAPPAAPQQFAPPVGGGYNPAQYPAPAAGAPAVPGINPQTGLPNQ